MLLYAQMLRHNNTDYYIYYYCIIIKTYKNIFSTNKVFIYIKNKCYIYNLSIYIYSKRLLYIIVYKLLIILYKFIQLFEALDNHIVAIIYVHAMLFLWNNKL